MNKQTDFKGQGDFILFSLCSYAADPATFRASNSVLETLFSSEESWGQFCLFSYDKYQYSVFDIFL